MSTWEVLCERARQPPQPHGLSQAASVLFSLRLKLTPLLSLTCSRSTSTFEGGVLRRARRGGWPDEVSAAERSEGRRL